jgi:spore coat protein CotF
MSLQRANVPQETYSDEESDIEDDDEDNDTERSKEPIEKTPVYNVEVDNLDVDKYPENSLDAYITKMKIPISNQVYLFTFLS